LRGQACQALSRFREAKENYLRAHRSHKHGGDIYGQMNAACRLGDVERQLENFSSAVGWYSLAYRLASRNSHHYSTMIHDAALGRALSLRGMGNLTAAAQELKMLAKKYRKADDKGGYAHAMWALGTTERFLGRLKEAESHLKLSVSLYTQLQDPVGLAYARCGLGGTLRMRGRAKESGQLYAKANNVFRKNGDAFGTAYSFCGQGNALRMQGFLKQSLIYSRQAFKIYTSLHQKSPLAFVLWTLAQTNISLKNYSLADHYLTRAEKLFKSVKDRRGLVYISLGRGELYRQQNIQKAPSFYNRAIRSAKRLNLQFEIVHGRRGLLLCQPQNKPSLNSIFRSYKKCGVNFGSFKHYSSLP
jgi:tetratricopeptide (TPR) repeat protein